MGWDGVGLDGMVWDAVGGGLWWLKNEDMVVDCPAGAPLMPGGKRSHRCFHSQRVALKRRGRHV